GVAIENSRNTPEAVATRWAKHVSADILPRNTKVMDDSVRGRLEESDGSRIVRKWYEGELGGIVHVDMIGYLFLNLYGTVVTSAVNDSFSHAFSLQQSVLHPTLTFFRKDDDVEQKVYGGGMVRTLSITANTEDYVRFSAEVVAAAESD